MLGLQPLEWMAFGSFHLEPCVTPVPPSQEQSCVAPGQSWDFALHLSDCRLKSYRFLSSPLFTLVLIKDTGNWFRA